MGRTDKVIVNSCVDGVEHKYLIIYSNYRFCCFVVNLPAAERLFLSNLPVKQWNSPVDSTSINFNRDRDWVSNEY